MPGQKVQRGRVKVQLRHSAFVQLECSGHTEAAAVVPA